MRDGNGNAAMQKDRPVTDQIAQKRRCLTRSDMLEI